MKNVIEFIKGLRKKPYGKAVFFFGFYLIFFIVIFIILNVGGNNKKTNNKDSLYKSLFNDNYSFTYKVVLDGENYLYSINKNSNVYSFIHDNKQYTTNGKNTYNDEVEVESPIKFSDFYKEELLMKILEKSYREAMTIYDNGDEVYNLLVSSNVLYKLVYSKDTDYEETPNKLKMSISNKKIKELEFNLDSYCKLDNLCKKSLNITINYNN